jgi:hypothetical protein
VCVCVCVSVREREKRDALCESSACSSSAIVSFPFLKGVQELFFQLSVGRHLWERACIDRGSNATVQEKKTAARICRLRGSHASHHTNPW